MRTQVVLCERAREGVRGDTHSDGLRDGDEADADEWGHAAAMSAESGEFS